MTYRRAIGDRPIIRDFSLRIQRGDRIGLVGPNGAGKTTLLKLLTGEIKPDSGKVSSARTLSAESSSTSSASSWSRSGA